MKQTNISLTEPQIKQLAEQAKKTGLSKAEIIRRALDDYLWDRQMEEDLKAGRLDGILAKAKKQYKEGKYSEI